MRLQWTELLLYGNIILANVRTGLQQPLYTLSARCGRVSAVLVAAVANDQSGAESRDVLLTAVCWGGNNNATPWNIFPDN